MNHEIKELKGKILLLEEALRQKAKIEATRHTIEQAFEEAKKIQEELEKSICSLIEGFLKGQKVDGQKLEFNKPEGFIMKGTKWIHAFQLDEENDNLLKVQIAEYINNSGPEFFTIIYDLKERKIIRKTTP